jgi:hypothetical protein
MDPNSGRIYGPEEIARLPEAERRGLIPIPKAVEKRVRTMTLEERKAWAAQQKRKVEKRRAAAKLARKARRKARA